MSASDQHTGGVCHDEGRPSMAAERRGERHRMTTERRGRRQWANLGAVTRILSDDKVLDNTLLNRLGAQVLRTVVARAAYTLRPVTTDEAVTAAVDELKTEGLLLLPNFLSPDHFEGVVQECAWLDRCPEHKLTTTEGPTIQEVSPIGRFGDSVLPRIHAFFRDARLSGLLEASEKWPFGDLAHYGIGQRLTHGAGAPRSKEDPQAELHSDIFFTSHKAWLFLDDVRLEDGPFVYVKRSHRLAASRLWAIYRHSCGKDELADPSRRMARAEQDRMSLVETIVTCPKNTLVVANVCGYHRRLQGQAGRQRHALALSLRTNPFLAHALRARLAGHARLYEALRRVKRQFANDP